MRQAPARRRSAALFALAFLAIFATTGAAKSDPPALFGTSETFSTNLAPFTKWMGTVRDASRFARYAPYYSINLAGWWLHRPQG